MQTKTLLSTIAMLLLLVLLTVFNGCGNEDEQPVDLPLVESTDPGIVSTEPPLDEEEPGALEALNLYAKIDGEAGVSSEYTSAADFTFKRFFVRNQSLDPVWISTDGNAAFITLKFPQQVNLARLMLWDIANFTDSSGTSVAIDLQGGRLTFRNEVTNQNPQDVLFESLPPDGNTPLVISSVQGYTVTELTLRISNSQDLVGGLPSGLNRSGLAELQVVGSRVDEAVARTNVAKFAMLESLVTIKKDDTGTPNHSKFGIFNLVDEASDAEGCTALPSDGDAFVSQGGGVNSGFIVKFSGNNDFKYLIDKVVVWDLKPSPATPKVLSFRLKFDDQSTTSEITLPKEVTPRCKVVDLTDTAIVPAASSAGVTTNSVEFIITDFEPAAEGSDVEKQSTGLTELRIFGKKN